MTMESVDCRYCLWTKTTVESVCVVTCSHMMMTTLRLVDGCHSHMIMTTANQLTADGCLDRVNDNDDDDKVDFIDCSGPGDNRA